MSKFDPKSPKGSVPNGQSKFLMRYAIRRFKCKLKAPNHTKSSRQFPSILFAKISIEKNLSSLNKSLFNIYLIVLTGDAQF